MVAFSVIENDSLAFDHPVVILSGIERLKNKNLKEEDSEQKNYLIRNIGYFIAYENLFSTWLSMGKNFDVSNVRDALNAFSRLINPDYKKVFDGIFKTLETGLSKLGDSSGTQTKSIIALLNLIKDIPMSGKQDYDVLGFIYEYLISMFAANAGKKAGEFYTPHEVSLLMSEIVANHLKDKEEIKIYDPTSGSGSLLINIGKSVQKHIAKEHHIKYYTKGFDMHALAELSESLESTIDYMTNCRDKIIVNKLLDFPLLRRLWIYRPANSKWLGYTFASIFPIGIPLYLIGISQQKQLKQEIQAIIKVSTAVMEMLETATSDR